MGDSKYITHVTNNEHMMAHIYPRINMLTLLIFRSTPPWQFQPLRVGMDLDSMDSDILVAPAEEEDAPKLRLAQVELNKRIQEIRVKHRRHETDTGSPEYQVAGMTERISHLTNHLKEHPKDFSTRRGLVALVNKRRRLLNYLYGEDEKRYVEIVGSLGIRHKVPGAIPSREDIYGRFPAAKPNKGKSKMKAAGKNARK